MSSHKYKENDKRRKTGFSTYLTQVVCFIHILKKWVTKLEVHVGDMLTLAIEFSQQPLSILTTNT